MLEPDSARVQVSLFGTIGVARGASAFRLTPHQLGLVVVVYSHSTKGVSRSKVARVLWGRAPTPSILQRLRQLLVDLHRRIGTRLFETNGAQLIPRRDILCDLELFEQSLDNGKLRLAADLASRGFGLVAPGPLSESYADWRASAEARLLRRLQATIEFRASVAAEIGDLDQALEAAHARALLSPGDPGYAADLIELLGRLGDSRGAEKAFASYLRRGVRTDGGEGAAPLEAIKRVRAADESTLSGKAPTELEVPLVGRGDALRAGMDALERIRRGSFETVLITGESGVGKTRLLRELHRRARADGFKCCWAQAVEPESRIPLNPILDCLKGVALRPHLAAMGSPWNGVIASMLPPDALADSARYPIPPIQDSALPRRLLDAFAMLFERIASEQPTLIFIDDLQWADATTITTLQFIQRRWRAGSLGLVASLRTDPLDTPGHAATYLADPPRWGGVCRIALTELDAGEDLELVLHLGDGHVTVETAQRLCALAGPHPLFLVETTRDYMAGRMRLPVRPAEEVPIPLPLTQILNARLALLSDDAIRLANVLAVAARPLPISSLSELVGIPVDSVVEVLDELRAFRLIQQHFDRIEIAHELFRSAIYHRLSGPRRARVHRDIAEHLVAHQIESSAGELAAHYARAGDGAAAARHGWIAAERAMASGAVAEAAQLYQLVSESDPDPTRRADATVALARVLCLTRDMTRALPILELGATRLRVLGREADAHRLEIRRVEALAENAATSLSELTDLTYRIKTTARARGDWETVALALDVELQLLHRRGDVRAIHDVFAEMREVADSGSPPATILAHCGLALGVLFADPREALRSAQLAVASTKPGESYRLKALLRLLVVLQTRGMLELPDWSWVADEALASGARGGDVLLRFSVENNLAVAAMDAGDLERASALMERVRALAGSAEMDLNRLIHLNNAAELSMARHEFDEAGRLYREALDYASTTTPPYLLHLIAAGQGLCALESGNLREARRRHRELPDPPEMWHYDPTTIITLRARLLQRTGRLNEAVDLLEVETAVLEHRMTLAWLKLRLLQARMVKKSADLSRCRAIARVALEQANRLNLRHRAREFTELLA